MADVRLTAVNPENSEVYPVACNDKGELILNGASRLEVADFLDVASTTYADNTGLYLGQTPGNVNFREIRLNKDGSAQFSKVVQVGGFVSYVRTDATDQNLASFSSNVGGLNVPQITLKAGGSATFAGNITGGGWDLSTAQNNFYINKGFLALAKDGADPGSGVFTCYSGGGFNSTFRIQADGTTQISGSLPASPNIELNADGKATFAGDVNASAIQATQPVANYRTFNGRFDNGGAVSDTAQIYADGTAVFSGNVTAPNITFKLAAATVAAMPAPLIDEGFAVNEELNLLSELMKMKLQIRDLNAFMQRTMQDASETTQ